MRKIAADRNYRLVKEAVKVNGVEMMTYKDLISISEEFSKQRANILENNSNIEKIFGAIKALESRLK